MEKKVDNTKELKVYANFEKLDEPTLEIDKEGNVKVTVGKFSIGGVK